VSQVNKGIGVFRQITGENTQVQSSQVEPLRRIFHDFFYLPKFLKETIKRMWASTNREHIFHKFVF